MATTQDLVGLEDVRAAAERLAGISMVTPLERSRALSGRIGCEVFVKCENLQRTGSFKTRGAYNRISRLDEADRQHGIVAASAGNHAQGVALAAGLTGIPATVYMPTGAPLPKIEATKRYGAEVELVGKDVGAALDAALDFATATGRVLVHPFDHPHVIAGQGTIGLEILEQLPEVATIVVPVGGGGLISGIAAAARSLKPDVKVIGVQAAGAASFPPSLDAGTPVTLEHLSTIADGIAANRPGDLTFAHVRDLVDRILLVNDDSIAEALVFAAERMKMVLEPAGAAGVAAVLQNPGAIDGPVAVVLSGGNIDPLLLLRVIRFGLGAAGRYFAFNTRIADRPGELSRLLGLIAEVGANIVGIHHHREGARVHVGDVEVTLQLETKGKDHIEQLVAALGEAGYGVERF